jgi:LmbE family N-acetylglucosaminyl deacetylase
MQKYDVVVFAAHPDDDVRHMGGTLAHLVRTGRSLLMVSLTSGQMGTYGDSETRKHEHEAAAKVLGADSRVLNLVDTAIENTNESRLAVAHLVREFQPTLVFAPYFERGAGVYSVSAHRDHSTTGQIVTEALLLARLSKIDSLTAHRVPNLLYYMLPPEVKPDILIAISDEDMHLALEAIAQQASQGNAFVADVTLAEYLTAQRRANYRVHGVQLPKGCNLAEAFVLASPLVLRGETLTMLSKKI